MFNTLWGKFRWLRLPFRLKITSDVFQERLDRVLRLIEEFMELQMTSSHMERRRFNMMVDY